MNIKGIGPSHPRHHIEQLPAKREAHPPVDQMEKRVDPRRLDPNDMKKHIDDILHGPFGPIHAAPMYGIRVDPSNPGPGPIALYAAPVPPEGGGGVSPFDPGMVALYAAPVPPGEKPPVIHDPGIIALYAVALPPGDKPPVIHDPGIIALYAVALPPGDDPPVIHDPGIIAMYGISLDDVRNRKA